MKCALWRKRSLKALLLLASSFVLLAHERSTIKFLDSVVTSEEKFVYLPENIRLLMIKLHNALPDISQDIDWINIRKGGNIIPYAWAHAVFSTITDTLKQRQLDFSEDEYKNCLLLSEEYQKALHTGDAFIAIDASSKGCQCKVWCNLLVKCNVKTFDLRVGLSNNCRALSDNGNVYIKGDLLVNGKVLGSDGQAFAPGPSGPPGATGAPGPNDLPASSEWGTDDTFGRKQLWYFDTSSVLRFGASTGDGDAFNQESEGMIIYGENSAGDPMSSDNFSFARIKPLLFALVNTSGGTAVNIFQANENGFTLKNDSNVITEEIDRARGTSRTAAGATGSRPTAANVAEQWFDTTLGIPIWWNGTAWVNVAGVVV